MVTANSCLQEKPQAPLICRHTQPSALLHLPWPWPQLPTRREGRPGREAILRAAVCQSAIANKRPKTGPKQPFFFLGSLGLHGGSSILGEVLSQGSGQPPGGQAALLTSRGLPSSSGPGLDSWAHCPVLPPAPGIGGPKPCPVPSGFLGGADGIHLPGEEQLHPCAEGVGAGRREKQVFPPAPTEGAGKGLHFLSIGCFFAKLP